MQFAYCKDDSNHVYLHVPHILRPSGLYSPDVESLAKKKENGITQHNYSQKPTTQPQRTQQIFFEAMCCQSKHNIQSTIVSHYGRQYINLKWRHLAVYFNFCLSPMMLQFQYLPAL